jgi:nucleoid DNA-binding protein
MNKTGENPETCSNVIDAFFDAIAEAVAARHSVRLHGSGVFKLVHRSERHGHTPTVTHEDGTVSGGEPWDRPEGMEFLFEPSDEYRQKIAAYSDEGLTRSICFSMRKPPVLATERLLYFTLLLFFSTCNFYAQ